jgi:hypothetical protein
VAAHALQVALLTPRIAAAQIGFEDDADAGVDYAACKAAADVVAAAHRKAAFDKAAAERAAAFAGR